MKLPILALLLLFQAATSTTPDPHRFHFLRTLAVSPSGASSAAPRACAALDGTTYEHARAGLADLRLYSAGAELPYALTRSDTPTASDQARVLNLGVRNHNVVFDLQMPHRPYSRVDLDLGLKDFIATARITGENTPNSSGTLLGTFDLFDFFTQGLTRNTTFTVAESSFPFLHVEIAFLGRGHGARDPYPEIVRGATIPPSRLAQTLYTTVAQTSTTQRILRESVVTFRVPAHVPIERVTFDLSGTGPRNFSRTVRIRAKADGDARASQEEVGGNISRLNMTEQGEKLQLESLSVPATVGSNGQVPATVEVGVDNGDDQPVGLSDVRLEMRERKICFDLPAGANSIQMLYGDANLQSPEYDYGRLFDTTTVFREATLQPEAANPAYTPPADTRTLTERHPEILWIALIAVILILGFVAYRSARSTPPPPAF